MRLRFRGGRKREGGDSYLGTQGVRVMNPHPHPNPDPIVETYKQNVVDPTLPSKFEGSVPSYGGASLPL